MFELNHVITNFFLYKISEIWGEMFGSKSETSTIAICCYGI